MNNRQFQRHVVQESSWRLLMLAVQWYTRPEHQTSPLKPPKTVSCMYTL